MGNRRTDRDWLEQKRLLRLTAGVAPYDKRRCLVRSRRYGTAVRVLYAWVRGKNVREAVVPGALESLAAGDGEPRR